MNVKVHQIYLFLLETSAWSPSHGKEDTHSSILLVELIWSWLVVLRRTQLPTTGLGCMATEWTRWLKCNHAPFFPLKTRKTMSEMYKATPSQEEVILIHLYYWLVCQTLWNIILFALQLLETWASASDATLTNGKSTLPTWQVPASCNHFPYTGERPSLGQLLLPHSTQTIE